MSEHLRELPADAKLARVVLDNCGPLSPPEVAEEGYLSDARARTAIAALVEAGMAEPVCGVCEEREEVYALTDTSDRSEP